MIALAIGEIMNRFHAQFDGSCCICALPIIEGDSIGYIEDELACEVCCDDEEAQVVLDIENFEPEIKND